MGRGGNLLYEKTQPTVEKPQFFSLPPQTWQQLTANYTQHKVLTPHLSYNQFYEDSKTVSFFINSCLFTSLKDIWIDKGQVGSKTWRVKMTAAQIKKSVTSSIVGNKIASLEVKENPSLGKFPSDISASAAIPVTVVAHNEIIQQSSSNHRTAIFTDNQLINTALTGDILAVEQLVKTFKPLEECCWQYNHLSNQLFLTSKDKIHGEIHLPPDSSTQFNAFIKEVEGK